MPEYRIIELVARDVTQPRNDGTPGSALYNIPFKLSGRPSAAWAEFFRHAWDHPSTFTSSHRPRISSVVGDVIWLSGTTMEEVEKTHRATLLLAVEEANRKTEEHEALEAAAEVKRRDAALEHERAVREAAKKITF